MNEWIRVTVGRPCRVCGRHTWCAVSAVTGMMLCMRIQSDKPVASGGWLHGEGNGYKPQPRPKPVTGYDPPTFDAGLWWRTVRYTGSHKLESWAKSLALPVDAMDVMGAAVFDETLVFPMHDGYGTVCGIRTRNKDGEKKALFGSKAGLFLPTMEPDADVVVCEGPTDATAALALGFWPIGRPSCSGCERHVADICRRKRIEKVTICADSDGVGLAGARKLAGVLHARKVSCRIVGAGGHKDLRDWFKHGATRQVVDNGWSQAEWD